MFLSSKKKAQAAGCCADTRVKYMLRFGIQKLEKAYMTIIESYMSLHKTKVRALFCGTKWFCFSYSSKELSARHKQEGAVLAEPHFLSCVIAAVRLGACTLQWDTYRHRLYGTATDSPSHEPHCHCLWEEQHRHQPC